MASKVTYQIATALSTSLVLTGQGDEQIVDILTGELIARFWNGNLCCSSQLSLAASAALMEESTLLIQEAA